MESFQVAFTPTRTAATRKIAQNREPVRMSMAPFTPKSVITFEEIPVGKSARRYLIIENPAEMPLLVRIVNKSPPQKSVKRVAFEWTEQTIPVNGEATVEICWSPVEAVNCKETFFVCDDRGFKKELHVIFKTVGRKVVVRKPLNAWTGATTGGLNVKTPSPPKRKRRYPMADMTLKSSKVSPGAANKRSIKSSPTAGYYGDKENILPVRSHFHSNHTHAVDCSGVLNGSDIFDKLQFTPAAKEACQLLGGVTQDMASLPTPTIRDFNHDLMSASRTMGSPLHAKTVHNVQAQMTTPTTSIAEEKKKTCTKTFYNVDLPDEDLMVVRSRGSTLAFDELVDDPALLLRRSEEDICNNVNATTCIRSDALTTPPLSQHLLQGDQLLQATFQVPKAVVSRVENIVTTPLQKKPSESMQNLSSKKTHEQLLLKINQGSMPNLNDIEKITSIESNRYYTRHAADCEDRVESQRPQHHDSSLILFEKNEIRAQSSCRNIHEIPDHASMTGIGGTGGGSIKPKATVTTQRMRCPLITLSPPKRQAAYPDPGRTLSHWSRSAKKLCTNSTTTTPYHSNNNINNALDLVHRLPRIKTEFKDVPRTVFYDIEMHMQTAINPDPFAATTTNDPFLSATMYLDQRAADKYEKQFKNWLNALVTVPEDMDSAAGELVQLDIGKIFNEVRNKKDTVLAQSKESVSCKYFTKYRMPHLRRVAVALYTGDELAVALSKMDVLIEKKQLAIRTDRDLHLDLVLQRHILELLLCFNTLWLRIGLEVVFGEEIQVSSNSDIYSLTGFILNRVFRDRYLENKYNRNFALTAKYSEQIKKFALRKLMHLVVFLDKAKEKKIISHNPCLFMRASPIKETKELLIKIASHLIGNIGDINKCLRRLGLTLTHKQTYLDEFEYAFTNLAVDLRDGIRLTKVMETILLRDDLTKLLRYPAISRLQKVHNVDLALKALSDAQYQIRGDICAKDIVDGHQEKTLSLLWQIIYKFRAPKFNAAARTIQRWWSVVRLQRTINYRVERTRQRRQIAAATVIQKHFRGFRCRRYLPEYIHERIVATVVIQTYFRAFIGRKKFRETKKAVIVLQSWWRYHRQTLQQRKQFVALRRAAIVIQRRFRANVDMRETVKKFEQLKVATLSCQRRYRAILVMRRHRDKFIRLKMVAIAVQQRFRAKVAGRVQRDAFARLKWAVQVIERAYRAKSAAKVQKMAYLRLRWATVTIQRQFRAQLAMRRHRSEYFAERSCAMVIQQYFRGYLQMRKAVGEMNRLKWAVAVLQRRYRSRLEMKRLRNDYIDTRRATVTIQRWYRNVKVRDECRRKYMTELKTVHCIQTRWRAKLVARAVRKEYVELQRVTRAVQQRFRATKVMQVQRARFVVQKRAAVCLQRKWRARQLGRITRVEYLRKRQVIVFVQRKWRATMAMRADVLAYKKAKRAVRIIQAKWLATMQMRRIRADFEAIRRAVITVQNKWRAILQMRQLRQHYKRMQVAAVVIQKHWRGLGGRREYKRLWNELNSPEAIELRRHNRAAVTIQTAWRGFITRKRHQTTAMRLMVTKINGTRRNGKDKVTVGMFLGASMKRLKLGLDVAEATKIFKSLDFYSRVVPHMLEENCVQVARYCYTVLSQAIRSEPHKYLIELCCRVVLNLARFPPTKRLIFLTEYLETISHILLRWSDKECPIFNTLCTLLFVLIQTPQHKTVIHNYMTIQDGVFIMRETKKAVIRKERMLNNKQKLGVFRTTDNAPTNERKKDLHVMPSLECDFGIERPAYLYVFRSRVFAFDVLLEQMQIQL